MDSKREFYVDTPLGKLKVWAKTEADDWNDYPGVYVDLVREGEQDVLLACTEYVSHDGYIQTCVYQPDADEPAEIVVHRTEEED